MIAVHFGAGNIGRGFIGALLAKSGYRVHFVDIDENLVGQLKQQRSYNVVLAGQEQQVEEVHGVTALHSNQDKQQVVDLIAEANLVTTAVGPNVLNAISGVIAEGLEKRLAQGAEPINVIACENIIGGSDVLRDAVEDKLSADAKDLIGQQFGFPNAAVDRIVPKQSNEGIDVSVEPFYEWVVDRNGLVDNVPPVDGITYVEDLAPYVERKLFTVNTGHAVTAYLGYLYGRPTIKDAIEDPDIYETVLGALKETGDLLVHKHGFNHDEHTAYIEKIIDRFRNPNISDEVTRVGRTPIRKLGENERLVGPARQLMALDGEHTVEHLATGIAAALQYDHPEDEEAVKLQAMVKEKGLAETLSEVAGLPKDHPLTSAVVHQVERLKNSRQL